MQNYKIIQIMPCKDKLFTAFVDYESEDKYFYRKTLGYMIVETFEGTHIDTFSENATGDFSPDSYSTNFTGYKLDTTEMSLELFDIVFKYADKFKSSWGIDEFVHQNDDAQVEAIDLFGEIIAYLPKQPRQEDEADGE